MKRWLILLAALSIGLLGQDRPLTFMRTDRGNVVFSISAKNIENETGSIVMLTNAMLTTKVLNISADQMKYNKETGEAELHGNVRVRISK